jgi:hypothetical protein
MSELAKIYSHIRSQSFDQLDLSLILTAAGPLPEENNLWDYKRTFPDRSAMGSDVYNYGIESLMKDVVAFYNSYGGVILSGIDDQSRTPCVGNANLAIDDLRKRIADKTGADIDLRHRVRDYTLRGERFSIGVLFIPQRGREPPVEFKMDAKARPVTATVQKKAYGKGVYLRQGPECRLAEGAKDWVFLTGEDRFRTYAHGGTREGDAFWHSLGARPRRHELRYFVRNFPNSPFHAEANRLLERPWWIADRGKRVGELLTTAFATACSIVLGIFKGIGLIIQFVLATFMVVASISFFVWVGVVIYQKWQGGEPGTSQSAASPQVQPKIEPIPEDITAPPHKTDDKWIVYPRTGKDAEGKFAKFFFYSLDTSFYWDRGKSEFLLRNDGSGRTVRYTLQQFVPFLRDAVSRPVTIKDRVTQVGIASDLISIGTASLEGSTPTEESARAQARGVSIAKTIVDNQLFRGRVWTLNLGQYKSDAKEARESHKQRPVIIVLVLEKQLGVDLGHALADAMHKRRGELPFPEDYREFVFLAFR